MLVPWQRSRVGRSLTSAFNRRCYGKRFLHGAFLYRNDKVLKVKVEPIVCKGVGVQGNVASYDPTRPSATPTF